MNGFLQKIVIIILCILSAIAKAADPLSLWNDTPVKQRILSFVASVTTPTNPIFIPPFDRVAVFDDAGTLWVEQPANFELQFAVDQLRSMDQSSLGWLNPVQLKTLLSDPATGIKMLNDAQRAKLLTYALKNNPAVYKQQVTAWFNRQKHPSLNCMYGQTAYAPMIQFVNYLKQSGFKVFIITGSGTDFVRIVSEAYGIPADEVFANPSTSSLKATTESDKVSLANTNSVKTLSIEKVLGAEPILAVGNDDADLPLLQFTAVNSPGLPLVLSHTNTSAPPEPDNKLLSYARKNHWLVIDMKKDFKQIFVSNDCRH